jgi:hypothetical protein
VPCFQAAFSEKASENPVKKQLQFRGILSQNPTKSITKIINFLK